MASAVLLNGPQKGHHVVMDHRESTLVVGRVESEALRLFDVYTPAYEYVGTAKRHSRDDGGRWLYVFKETRK